MSSLAYQSVDYADLEVRAIARMISECMAAVVNGARRVETIARAVHEGEILTRFVLDHLVETGRLTRSGAYYSIAAE